jgi:8-oxo-dGTP pyrophosphatase MutT (NUDIX family)
MYKVFINNKSIFIGEKNEFPPLSASDKTFSFSEKNSLMQQLQLFENDTLSETLYICGNPEEIIKCFIWVDAAGGLVTDNNKKMLFIFRNGKWDLPKGKVEKKEGIMEAAMREVEEECGISGLTIIKTLSPTYHTYILKNERVLKITYWYTMTCSNCSNPKPQLSENITDIKWLTVEDLPMVFANTFSSIKETVRGFLANK